jgi:hypothetical protein
MLDFSRLGNVNPLLWVVMIIAAVLGYGARKLVVLMKIPEAKQQKFVVILKSAAMLLLVLDFIVLLITM